MHVAAKKIGKNNLHDKNSFTSELYRRVSSFVQGKQRGTGRQAERSMSLTCIIQADSDATLSKGESSSDKNAWRETKIRKDKDPLTAMSCRKRGKLECPTRMRRTTSNMTTTPTTTTTTTMSR